VRVRASDVPSDVRNNVGVDVKRKHNMNDLSMSQLGEEERQVSHRTILWPAWAVDSSPNRLSGFGIKPGCGVEKMDRLIIVAKNFDSSPLVAIVR
jgi:hypothetical protein